MKTLKTPLRSQKRMDLKSKHLFLFAILIFSSQLFGQCSDLVVNTTLFSQNGLTTCGSGDDFSSSNVCASSYMGGDDFVIVYTPNTTGCVQIALTGTDTWTGVFLTSLCPSNPAAVCIGNNTNSSGNPTLGGMSVTAGQTYFITISTWPSPQCTPFNIAITACPPAPANDLCSGAINLPCGTNNLPGTTVASTSVINGTGCSMSDYGVWYTFIGDGTPTTISASPASGYDIEMSISSGSCGGLTSIACRDAGNPETHTFTTTNGVNYFVYIAHYSTSSTTTGTFTISRTCPLPPCTSTTMACGTSYSATYCNSS